MNHGTYLGTSGDPAGMMSRWPIRNGIGGHV
jgi:hypothetical protein